MLTGESGRPVAQSPGTLRCEQLLGGTRQKKEVQVLETGGGRGAL